MGKCDDEFSVVVKMGSVPQEYRLMFAEMLSSAEFVASRFAHRGGGEIVTVKMDHKMMHGDGFVWHNFDVRRVSDVVVFGG